MSMFCEKDYEAMSRRAAQVIAAEITHNPACVLGLATGSTPEGAYKYLVDWHKQGCLSFKDVLSVWTSTWGWLPRMTRATVTSCRATSSTMWTSFRRTPGSPTA